MAALPPTSGRLPDEAAQGQHMREISLLAPSKQTDNKLRWEAWESGVLFKVYIPKWRVPKPWPVRIVVRIDDDEKTFEAIQPPRGPEFASSRDLNESLVAVLQKVDEHTETVRYRQIGDLALSEIGEPYIPFSMLGTPPPDRMRIDVAWDRSVGTWTDQSAD